MISDSIPNRPLCLCVSAHVVGLWFNPGVRCHDPAWDQGLASGHCWHSWWHWHRALITLWWQTDTDRQWCQLYQGELERGEKLEIYIEQTPHSVCVCLCCLCLSSSVSYWLFLLLILLGNRFQLNWAMPSEGHVDYFRSISIFIRRIPLTACLCLMNKQHCNLDDLQTFLKGFL